MCRTLNVARQTTVLRMRLRLPLARWSQRSGFEMTPHGLLNRARGQRGSVLLETAMTLPLLLLVTVAIFELGRAYQTQQILTNAAREGARMAVLPGASASD